MQEEIEADPNIDTATGMGIEGDTVLSREQQNEQDAERYQQATKALACLKI